MPGHLLVPRRTYLWSDLQLAGAPWPPPAFPATPVCGGREVLLRRSEAEEARSAGRPARGTRRAALRLYENATSDSTWRIMILMRTWAHVVVVLDQPMSVRNGIGSLAVDSHAWGRPYMSCMRASLTLQGW